MALSHTAPVSELDALVRVLRRQGDEAQFTQAIAAIAREDRGFADGFARAIIETVCHSNPPTVPSSLVCRAERTLVDDEGSRSGRGDLLFEDEAATFSLLVELKLHSDYGDRQLERYLQSLDALQGAHGWLIAVTSHTPHAGEPPVGRDPRWLGSIRWADAYSRLTELADDLQTRKHALAEGWRALLAVMRAQGDFGPMDFEPDLLVAWGRREEAERALSQILRHLMPTTLETLRSALGADPRDETAASVILKGPSQPVNVSKKRVLMRFRAGGPERFWIQFYARQDGSAIFTAEVRHQIPTSKLSPAVRQAAEAAGGELEHGKDSQGHSWKLPALHAEQLPAGADVHNALQDHIAATISRCRSVGLFEALAQDRIATISTEPLVNLDERA